MNEKKPREIEARPRRGIEKEQSTPEKKQVNGLRERPDVGLALHPGPAEKLGFGGPQIT